MELFNHSQPLGSGDQPLPCPLVTRVLCMSLTGAEMMLAGTGSSWTFRALWRGVAVAGPSSQPGFKLLTDSHTLDFTFSRIDSCNFGWGEVGSVTPGNAQGLLMTVLRLLLIPCSGVTPGSAPDTTYAISGMESSSASCLFPLHCFSSSGFHLFKKL